MYLGHAERHSEDSGLSNFKQEQRVSILKYPLHEMRAIELSHEVGGESAKVAPPLFHGKIG